MTRNWSRPVRTGFLRSWSGPVQFFDALGFWWTGLGLGTCPWGAKNRTGPDFKALDLLLDGYLKTGTVCSDSQKTRPLYTLQEAQQLLRNMWIGNPLGSDW
jgi:hypothetical protein